MANPYKSQGASSAKMKFGKLGLPTANAKHSDEANKARADKVIGPGTKEHHTPKFARGGRTAGKVNIVITSGQQPPTPSLAGPTAMPPSMPMAPPPAPPMGGQPPMAPPGGGLTSPIGPAAAGINPMSPVLRQTGGRVSKYIGGQSTSSNLKQWASKVRSNSYQAKAAGGRIPTKGGAETAVGRLQKAGYSVKGTVGKSPK